VLSNRASGKEEGGFLFVWDTGDPKTARESLEKLERLREFFGSISSEKISTDGREVTRWQAEGRTILTHGWLDNDSLFVALGVSYAGRPDSPITANPNFQRAIEGFPKNGFGYFFLDVERFLEMSAASPDLSNRVPLDPSGRALLESVRAVGSTASWVDATTSQVDISVLLK
jgi:hypothetical protein